ncbi:vWA domain-containing protein [Streptomyces winkii]|uniref:vWA domain-containing protein n=1 Tax=Streptomyces winkii TaxID=3051178 RepID=UPI0028D3FA11|nr:vWA domain-containing protein [Streptomyces sp. DSM 40971]
MIQQTTGRGAEVRAARRTARRAAATAVLLVGALLTPLFAGAGAVAEERAGARAGAAAGESGDKGPDPIDFAVVVDQSKSLSKKDLQREVEAAALISQGEISDRSRAMVMGFGSAEKEGQSAVDEVCELTVADAPGRQELSDCVQELARSSHKKTGPGTDFPAALSQARDRLTEDSEPGRPKVVFLLTDGKLDVRDSSGYGKEDDPAARQKNGEKALKGEFEKARKEQIQLWPLGFGAVDKGALGEMAAGGYRGACAELPGAKPRMRVVEESAQLEKALQETFADARCARVEEGTKGKPPTDLHVTIPPIATDGSITVTKRDPEVRATYYDPKGNEVPRNGRKFGSSFELSGEEGPVEALRVKDPEPGKWKVHLDAPEDHREQTASVSAIWQGRLRSLVTLDPTSPKPGEKAEIEARLQTRDDVVVDDSDQLGGVHATATLKGDGFDPVKVPLRDDGEGGDEERGDAHFSGSVEIPGSATGALSLTSEMAAPGVTGDKRPYHTVITAGSAPMTAHASVDGHSVHPGGKVEGTLNARNDSGSTHTLRLRLADRRGDSVSVRPSGVRVPAGKTRTVHYRLAFDGHTPIGEAGGRIEVVDTTDGGRVVDETPLAVSVTAPPSWWDIWWWAVVGGAALALFAAVVAKLRIAAGRRTRDVAGLTLELLRNGLVESTQKTRRGSAFEFTVDTGGPRPRLSASRSGASGAYRLTRDRSGAVVIRPPRGKQHARTGNALKLGDGLELVLKGGKLSGGAAAGSAERPRRTNPFAWLKFPSPKAGSGEPGRRGEEPDGTQRAGRRESTPPAPGRNRLPDHF